MNARLAIERSEELKASFLNQAKEGTWNNLTSTQKRAFGDRFITNNSNLEAWNKDFDSLSVLKQNRVLFSLNESMIDTLNYVI